MKYRVVYTETVLAELESFVGRLKEQDNWGPAAARWVAMLVGTIDSLERMPRRSPVSRPYTRRLGLTIRKKIVVCLSALALFSPAIAQEVATFLPEHAVRWSAAAGAGSARARAAVIVTADQYDKVPSWNLGAAKRSGEVVRDALVTHAGWTRSAITELWGDKVHEGAVESAIMAAAESIAGDRYTPVITQGRLVAWLNRGETEVTQEQWPDGYRYILPTEAEWELACRAGSRTAYCFGDGAHALKDYAVFDESRSGEYAHALKSRRANEWGFFDMHGNVWEWCLDGRDEGAEDTYRDGVVDPPRSVSGPQRVCRGGSWSFSARFLRSAFRFSLGPGVADSFLGFRPALAASSAARRFQGDGSAASLKDVAGRLRMQSTSPPGSRRTRMGPASATSGPNRVLCVPGLVAA